MGDCAVQYILYRLNQEHGAARPVVIVTLLHLTRVIVHIDGTVRQKMRCVIGFTLPDLTAVVVHTRVSLTTRSTSGHSIRVVLRRYVLCRTRETGKAVATCKTLSTFDECRLIVDARTAHAGTVLAMSGRRSRINLAKRHFDKMQ